MVDRRANKIEIKKAVEKKFQSEGFKSRHHQPNWKKEETWQISRQNILL